MRRLLPSLAIFFLCSSSIPAAEIQGVLADWNCTEKMVRDGREKVLKENGNCSLVPNPARSAYGLITDDKKFYRLDDKGNRRAKMLLRNSHNRNNLRVHTEGDLQGNLIEVHTMTIL